MSEVSSELKQHIWALYEAATSPDPSIAVQYVGKLISHLQIAMKMSGVNEFDALLSRNKFLARRAWYEYCTGRSGQAMQTAGVVTSEVGFLVYDKRFSVAKGAAFITNRVE